MTQAPVTLSLLPIARVCHEVNKAICEFYGDNSQPDWLDAEGWQKESAMRGVEFALANPNLTPEDQHNAWMADKLADGWKYGETKDAEAKTHPCIRPYSELPDSQKIKDHVFRAIVKAMAS